MVGCFEELIIFISAVPEVGISGINQSQEFSFCTLTNSWDRQLFAVRFIRSVWLPLCLKAQELTGSSFRKIGIFEHPPFCPGQCGLQPAVQPSWALELPPPLSLPCCCLRISVGSAWCLCMWAGAGSNPAT